MKLKIGDRVRARKDGRLVEGVVQWIAYAEGVPQLEVVLDNRCMVRLTGRDLVPFVPITAAQDATSS